MVDLNGFNADDHEELSFDPLPSGDYMCVATASTWKDTAAGNGNRYLQFDLKVIDGEFENRPLWDRMNLQNKNATAVKIANGQLASLCRAVGVLRPKDSGELHNKPFVARVELEERKDRPGSYSNRIKGYYAASGHKAPAPLAQSSQQDSTPPWKK